MDVGIAVAIYPKKFFVHEGVDPDLRLPPSLLDPMSKPRFDTRAPHATAPPSLMPIPISVKWVAIRCRAPSPPTFRGESANQTTSTLSLHTFIVKTSNE